MSAHFLAIEITQLSRKLESIKDNEYFNSGLKGYFENLYQFSKAMESEIETLSTKPISVKDLDRLSDYLKFIKQSCLYLEDSTLNIIPYETVYCLKRALLDWVVDPPAIVTSLKAESYYFAGYLSLSESLYKSIESDYGVSFDTRLISLGVPQLEVYNYLYNIVLYHELGHYVDSYFEISRRLIITHYPGLSTSNKKEFLRKYYYFMEHFADLFAAQYVGSLVIDYLNFLAPNASDSSTHPSTKSREKVVIDWLDGNSNTLVETIKNATLQITGEELKIRSKEINSQSFEKFIPHKVSSEEELHGIYSYGWKLWNERDEAYAGYSDSRVFMIINNLIEKSISNYMITENWNTL